MKQIRLIRTASRALILLAIGGTWQARSQDAVPFTAKIVRLTGAAHGSVGGKPWQMLKVGDVLRAGTLIQTARTKSLMDIQLGESGGANANIVRLLDDSAMEIKTLAAKGTGADRAEEIELDLRAGQIAGRVKKFKEGSVYRVMLPTGAAGIRGDLADNRETAYVLKSSGALMVISGKMAIAIASESTVAQIVAADQQFDPAVGQVTKLAPDAPERKLLK